MGLDVMYSKLQSATAFNGLAVGSGDTPRPPRNIAEPRSVTGDRSGQLVVPVPRAPRLLSLIGDHGPLNTSPRQETAGGFSLARHGR